MYAASVGLPRHHCAVVDAIEGGASVAEGASGGEACAKKHLYVLGEGGKRGLGDFLLFW